MDEASITAAIARWMEDRAPCKFQGAFCFDLAVYQGNRVIMRAEQAFVKIARAQGS